MIIHLQDQNCFYELNKDADKNPYLIYQYH